MFPGNINSILLLTIMDLTSPNKFAALHLKSKRKLGGVCVSVVI